MRPGCIVEHEAEAPAALLGRWLEDEQIVYATVRPHAGEELPTDPSEFAWLVSLGSEFSVNATQPGWIADEIELLRQCVRAEVPVLGICFGGQALSRALGGRVQPADPPTIGSYRVRSEDPDLVPEGPWLHFNYEIFTVPDGASEVARTDGGPAAFRAGPHLGVQFHPEATPEIFAGWLALNAERIRALGLDADAIRAEAERDPGSASAGAAALFAAWWRGVGGG